MTELLIRQAEVREVDEEAREVTGLAVPYGQVAAVDGIKERFESRALDDLAEGQTLPLFYGHGHLRGETPIGSVIAGRSTDEGFEVRARIAKTTRGDEVYALLREGVIKAFSVGFSPVTHRMDGEVVSRTKAVLRELSLTALPAYAGALVSQVREDDTTKTKEAPMTETDYAPRADLIEVRESVEDIARRLDVLGDVRSTDEPVGSQFRTYGEYVKGFVAQSDDAVALYRAWTGGGTTGDSVVKTGWVGDLTRLVEKPRKVINAFRTAPLPPEGNSIEYARLEANTIAVAEQANEGDTLVMGKVSIETASAQVRTFGGFAPLSRQAIERASVPYLDRVFQALAIEYARATEAAARAAIDAAAAKTIAGASIATFDGWIDYLADAASHLEDKGLTIDGVLISTDVFKSAAKLKSGDRYLLDRTQGTVDVKGLAGSILNVPFTVVSGTNVATVYNETAMTTRESAGAPARLNDQDITNLTVGHSVYGYAAFAVEDPKALVKRGA